MTVLSDVDICRELNNKIKIEDYDDSCLRPSSYLLRLSKEVFVSKKESFDIDTKKSDTSEFYDSFLMGEEGFVLEPGKFLLACSVEKISLSSYVCADLGLLSPYARIGLSLNLGSNLVAATFGVNKPSAITFEIKNSSNNYIKIYPNVKFCHIRFLYQNSLSKCSYNGIYSGSSGPMPANFNIKPAK